MQPINKILVNTLLLYLKIIICMLISLYTVPIVLHALGENDYGLYTVIAGLIAMLSFLNASMSISTQRYLSVTMGENNPRKLLEVYNNSILLHVIIALGIVLLIEILMPWVVDKVLTIDSSKIDAATTLFHLLVVNIFFTIVTVPFDAVLNAYEDMLAFSVISILEAILKFLAALSITFVTTDRLSFYGIGLCIATILVFVIKYAYTRFKYRSLYLSLSACHNKKLLKEMFGFAGWNTLTSFAIIGRNQGIAIVLNHFWGSVINAAYGIGNQVNGVLNYFSSTIQKSVNPQLMMSEGLQERDRLFSMSFGLTKFSCLCLSAIALPLLFEMPTILTLWLHEYPRYTIEFTRLIILLSLIYQASSGIMSAIQSSGRIKWYTITISILLTLPIPLAYFGVIVGISPTTVMWIVCVSEFIAFFVRLLFARHLLDFPIKDYCKQVVFPIILQSLGIGILLYGITVLMPPSVIRLITVLAADVVLFLTSTRLFILTKEENQYIDGLLKKLYNTLHR